MELIKIEEREGKKLVSGRELHEFLEVTERFSNWFDRQLAYGFEENVDYTGCKVFNTLARQELQDYIISIDMAKEISMIQRTDKGREARRYFIACEKQVKQLSELDLIIQSAQALKLVTDRLEDTENKVELLDKKFDSVVTLESGKQRKLQKAINFRVMERFISLTFYWISNENGDGKTEEDCKKLKRKLFSAIHRELKNKFGVASYKDIKVAEYETALHWIENWVENADIREMV